MKLTKTAIGDVDDTGLEATAAARHYGIAVPLPAPADPGAQKFVFQYEVTLKVRRGRGRGRGHFHSSCAARCITTRLVACHLKRQLPSAAAGNGLTA